MKNIKVFFIFFLSLFTIHYSQSTFSYAAQSEDYAKVGMGARVLGMGRSFVGLADDANSIFINPAGISQINYPSLTSVFTNLGGEVNYTVLGYTTPTRIGPIGIGYLSSTVGGLYVTELGSDGIIKTVSSFDFASSLLTLSYAKEMNEKFASGISIKFFNKSFSNQTGGSGSGYNIDLGFLCRIREGMKLGINLQNFLSGNTMNWGTGKSETMTSKTRIGLSNKIRKQLTWDIDLEIESSGKPWLLSSGVEWEVTKALMLRGGLTQDALPGGSTTTNITLGMGLRINRITFDYGYKIDSLIAEANAGYFSITYNFGEKKEVKEKAKEDENKEIKDNKGIKGNEEIKENKKEETPEIKNKVMEI
jgi:hypothetical protein